YAQARWQRVSRVQQRARRNGTIFHADGWLRLARDTALALGGPYMMDLPWLYAG
ncbi:MAG: FAD-dependent oxidoreductase, partial [Betaproteobacteria bacterium]